MPDIEKQIDSLAESMATVFEQIEDTLTTYPYGERGIPDTWKVPLQMLQNIGKMMDMSNALRAASKAETELVPVLNQRIGRALGTFKRLGGFIKAQTDKGKLSKTTTALAAEILDIGKNLVNVSKELQSIK